ncbi:MAG: (Fe-S)-binding protein [Candidatus Helarchaeota archaeon]
MTEAITKKERTEKYKHLSKVKNMIMQCISCGDCREATDHTMSPPKWGVCVAYEHTSGFEPFFGRGKMQIARSILQDNLKLSRELAEVIYQCPTCNSCSNTCAYDFDNATIYEALRAELVEAGFELAGHKSMNEAIVQLLNPYQRDNNEKGAWLEKLDFRVKDANSASADILYYVGCTSALTPEIQSVAINTAKVLHTLGIDFTVLGGAEICCGSVALRTGDLKTFNFTIEKNLESFRKIGVKTIITSCAGCYRTFKKDYGEQLTGLGIKVLHTIEFLEQLLDKNELPLKPLGISATFHDPCHTGRNSGGTPLYEAPRKILAKIASIKEMKTIKENAKCCGAGGGVKKAFPELALDIAKSRVQEAEETGADYLISICPFCNRNLSDAIKALSSNLKMRDLLELIEQAWKFNNI